MSSFKSHFNYSKSQRNGIFLWGIIVLVLQFILLLFNNIDENTYEVSVTEKEIQSELDSLFLLDTQVEFKRYPFNPNYLSDYKAYQLGMSIVEIDRLLVYRESGKYINSSQDFQQITHVSDSLLSTIAPYFKFPDWVIKKQSTDKKYKKQKKLSKILIKQL